MNWQFHTFNTLSTRDLFDFMKLRVDVFVVEQACAYPELDNHDISESTLHLLGYDATRLVAYARAITATHHPGDTEAVKIGRVVVASSHRGTGVAQALMTTMLNKLNVEYPTCSPYLAAQYAIMDFYQAFGFTPISEVYQEDGIPHIDMHRSPSTARARELGQTNSRQNND